MTDNAHQRGRAVVSEDDEASSIAQETNMTNTIRLTVSTVALFAGLSVASAQTTPPADPHHPAAAAPGAGASPAPVGSMAPTPGQAPGPGMSGMMGQMMGGHMDQMMSMMRMMRGMMDAHPDQMGRMAMMPTDHVEGRIAFLKVELGITEAQLPMWNAFADAMRTGATAMRGAMAQAMQSTAQATMPARMDAMVTMMAARHASLKATATAGKALYDVLTDAQKRLADTLIMSPMGGM